MKAFPTRTNTNACMHTTHMLYFLFTLSAVVVVVCHNEIVYRSFFSGTFLSKVFFFGSLSISTPSPLFDFLVPWTFTAVSLSLSSFFLLYLLFLLFLCHFSHCIVWCWLCSNCSIDSSSFIKIKEPNLQIYTPNIRKICIRRHNVSLFFHLLSMPPNSMCSDGFYDKKF